MPQPAAQAAANAVQAERRRNRRGLIAIPRTLSVLPSVMTSPPTVTPGVASGSTQIASSTLVSWTDTRFRYLGGAAVVAGTGFPDNTLARYRQHTSSTNPANMRLEFMHYGSSFEFLMKAQVGAKWRLVVNGQPATGTGQLLSGTTGSLYLVLVDFGSVAARHIEIEGAVMYFGGVRIGPNDSLWKPALDPGPRVIVFGDSYTEGTGASMTTMGYAQNLCTLLGWRDAWISGVGGTGYLNDAQTTGKVKFRSRLAADVIAYSPDVFICAGGINDYANYTMVNIGAEVTGIATDLRTALPNCVQIFTGPWDNSGNVPTAAFVQTRDTIRSAALAAGADLFVDNIAGPIPWSGNTNNYVNQGWITGTGHVGSTTGSGNADLFVSSDGLHPSQAGHDYYGHRVASSISAWRAAGCPAGATVTNGLVAA